MAQQIQANYDDLQDVASRFTNQAQAIQAMLQRVSSSYSKLRGGGWQGRGADAFFGEMEDIVLPATGRLQDALEQAGQATGNIARAVKQAEEEASSLFR